MANSHSDAGGPAPDTFGSQNANVPSAAGGEDAHADVPKHEVGWYFVKQYYTNLSRSPDKWHVSHLLPPRPAWLAANLHLPAR